MFLIECLTLLHSYILTVLIRKIDLVCSNNFLYKFIKNYGKKCIKCDKIQKEYYDIKRKKGVNMANSRTNKINKQKELEQRKRKKRKILLVILILITIIVAICAYLLTSEKFDIQKIIIEGNNQLSQEEIYELSEIKLGDNIFETIGIITKVKLKRNGYIEDAKIEKVYPNQIKIEITERKKEFQILTETGCYIYIDEQGYILDYSLDKLELITITGMEITESRIQEIKRLEEKDLDKMEKILHIREEAKEIGIESQIQQIETKNNEYIIHMDNDNIIIKLGDATNLNNRMLYVKAILKEEAGHSGTIFVDGNINEGFAPYFSAN